MVQDIDLIVNNDWGSDMIDLKHDFIKGDGSYKPFTQKEAIEMSKALGSIYSISHGVACVCGNKYIKPK